jgi:phosphoribosylanthranilate isomerase
MRDPVLVKICGLTRPDDVDAAAKAGASYLGFVFFPKSPRHLELDQARALAQSVPPGLCRVALVVDADDATLDQLLANVPVDMVQLHGHESPDRVAAIRARHGLPVMKALGVADATDLPQLDQYAKVADQLLVDAKPPRGADLPGGNGLSFDWRLIAGRRWSVPWMLAGGLTPDNVADAIRLTGARQVDVSSGVEAMPGLKDPARIAKFVRAAQHQA